MIGLDAGGLTFRLITEDDWALFLQLYHNEQVLQYVSDPLSECQIRQLFDERLKPWRIGDLHWLCLVAVEKYSGNAVGVCGFHGLDIDADAPVTAEVGYLFLPEYFGKGYATLTLQATLNYGAQLGVELWHAVVTEGNTGSGRVLEKCGFHLVDRQHNGYQIADTFVADLIYKRPALQE